MRTPRAFPQMNEISTYPGKEKKQKGENSTLIALMVYAPKCRSMGSCAQGLLGGISAGEGVPVLCLVLGAR